MKAIPSLIHIAAVTLLASLASTAQAGVVGSTTFVNGLALDGAMLDKSSGSDVNRRVGYFF
jgi:hypothetical protein